MNKVPGDRFQDPALTGLPEAERILGLPVRLVNPEVVPPVERGVRHPFGRSRRAEIVFVLPRPGGLLVHGKSFYPPGLLRLLSGGLRAGEPVMVAARRELKEETGLVVEPKRFLFHLVQDAQTPSGLRSFHSLGFLYPETTQPVRPNDPNERITELRVLPWERIPDIVRHLENLDAHWRAWGRFRAAPHLLLLDARRRHPEWFEGEKAPGVS